MKVIRYPEKPGWKELLQRPLQDIRALNDKVRPILDRVRTEGDKALREFTAKFDRIDLENFEITEKEFIQADEKVDEELKTAINVAIRNIEIFHQAQKIQSKKIKTTDGVECWQKAVAIQRVGLYVPGGTAPLFSTVLMLAIPAHIAGCSEIILCSPPGNDGNIAPAVLYAAKLTGVTRVFKIGGAQAIAAMAYGTESVPKVDKIFGPGNQYVTAAKQLISRESVAIDMPAGPSEVAVIADDSSDPVFVASDLLSQAEHGLDSQVLMVTTNEMIIDTVQNELTKQLQALPRKDFASRSLENSKIILLQNQQLVIELVNEYAPEHLIISTKNADELAEQVINAGSVFIGEYTPESAGDYASGTNHTLPTNGYAKMYNGVNLDSFVKKITFQKITKQGLENIGPAIMKMAEAEKLTAHKNAITVRLTPKN